MEKQSVQTVTIYSPLSYHLCRTPYKAHSHNHYEFLIMLQGKAIHNLNSEIEILSKGDIRLLTPADTHSIEKYNNYEHKHLNVIADKKNFEELVDYIFPGFFSVLVQQRSSIKLHINNTELTVLRNLLNFTSLSELSLQNTNKALIMTTKLLLIECLKLYYNNIGNYSVSVPPIFSSLIKEFNNPLNFDKKISELITTTNYSHNQTLRLFHKYYGKSLSEYFSDQKFSYAAEQLKYTDKSILEISQLIGINSLSHFYHLFKAKYGFAPNEFRQIQQSKNELKD